MKWFRFFALICLGIAISALWWAVRDPDVTGVVTHVEYTGTGRLMTIDYGDEGTIQAHGQADVGDRMPTRLSDLRKVQGMPQFRHKPADVR